MFHILINVFWEGHVRRTRGDVFAKKQQQQPTHENASDTSHTDTNRKTHTDGDEMDAEAVNGS